MVSPTGSSSEQKRVIMLAYYAYYLHDRSNRYNYLSRTERLFQQYVITAFFAIEQNHAEFVRGYQNDIRNEYLSSIYDANNRGDNDGSDCGSRHILPQSFMGGPHYMYSHYLDALANCRVYENPSYLITFTYKSVRVRKEEDIDVYISAKLPSEDVDLECYKCVIFKERDRLDSVVLNTHKKKTTLTEWLYYNEHNTDGRYLTYLNFHYEFVLYADGKYWRRCRIRTKLSVAACEALGLLEDDREWEITLQEATLTTTPAELRTLLAHILTFCQVSVGSNF
ncbi:DNA helicase [Tanacetum coccineum]